MSASLYLIPTQLGPEGEWAIPNRVLEILNSVEIIYCENLKQARRNMRAMGFKGNFNELKMEEMDKRSDINHGLELIAPLQEGKSAVYLSDAGCPGVADPGSVLVGLCHDFGIQVSPIPGPSSILLGLMASGFNGQSFKFHGYLPIEDRSRLKSLKQLEQSAKLQQETQIFIETPYRNPQLMEAMWKHLHEDTRVCIAANLTMPNEYVRTMSVRRWKQEKINLKKQAAVFLIG